MQVIRRAMGGMACWWDAMKDRALGGPLKAGTWVGRWRQLLAAMLLLLAGLVFVAVGWAAGITLPNGLWLALVAVASLAVAAHPPEQQAWMAAEEPAAPPRSLPAEGAAPAQIMLVAASHEFRTPLNAIIGFSELLRDAERNGTVQEERGKYVTAILDNARHLQQRLNDVLDANRLANGALSLTEQPCDLAEIIESICRERQAAAQARGITIIARIADGITCHADMRRMRQAFSCVIDNAIAFSPKDGMININMHRGSGGGLVVSVTDAGPGMTAGDLALAFEPFRQADEGIGRRHEGLGLGLYIARGLMRLHGGEVTVTSSPAAGTDVRLSLPPARVHWQPSRAVRDTDVAHVA